MLSKFLRTLQTWRCVYWCSLAMRACGVSVADGWVFMFACVVSLLHIPTTNDEWYIIIKAVSNQFTKWKLSIFAAEKWFHQMYVEVDTSMFTNDIMECGRQASESVNMSIKFKYTLFELKYFGIHVWWNKKNRSKFDFVSVISHSWCLATSKVDQLYFIILCKIFFSKSPKEIKNVGAAIVVGFVAVSGNSLVFRVGT